jgi:alkanesulfonate monooxygenase SsuD/methylene tetrahydromethanopterin reductase-like flavin-dependent oxidoreductase (luciferase family)
MRSFDEIKSLVSELICNAEQNGYYVLSLTPEQLAQEIADYASIEEDSFEMLVSVIHNIQTEVYNNVSEGLVND